MKNVFERGIASALTELLGANDSAPDWSEVHLLALLEQPPDPEMGDYAFPCFQLARQFRKAPPAIAAELAEQWAASGASTPGVEQVRAVGPYLNFTIAPGALASEILPALADGSAFSTAPAETRERVMIEFSQPNTHKGFHVGHLRNVALGDALCRIFRYNGYEVVGANYIGDVGTHIAKCLWYYQRFNEEAPPEQQRGEWLGELYTKATLLLEDAPADQRETYQLEVREILQKLEGGDPELDTIWQETRQWSLDDFEEIYKWLGVHFDRIFFESEVDDEGKEIVLQGEQGNMFQVSDGAIGIDLEDEKLGFFLLLKSDGTTLYSTKDLALAKRKFEQYGIDRSIYVVGAEQTLHFKQVFATLRKMGYEQAELCHHLPYALVMLPDGKMSSRAGNVILFSQLREKILNSLRTQHFQARQGEWPDAEIEETSRRVAIAALKYGMLAQDPAKNIIFSMEDWLKTEGDTGTYLVYAYVRICSIVRQLGIEPSAEADCSLLVHPNEKALSRRLLDFNRVVWSAGEQFKPSLLAHALYGLARDFSRAYTTCSVKHAETPDLQHARLLLFHGVAETLKQGLDLLGIAPPERL
ncbi:MAG: arginine--tRNA ligase [SAR324 cluster bacterium]|nr:arginine--tRNA ligase [SAR324 cluster bacterium]